MLNHQLKTDHTLIYQQNFQEFKKDSIIYETIIPKSKFEVKNKKNERHFGNSLLNYSITDIAEISNKLTNGIYETSRAKNTKKKVLERSREKSSCKVKNNPLKKKISNLHDENNISTSTKEIYSKNNKSKRRSRKYEEKKRFSKNNTSNRISSNNSNNNMDNKDNSKDKNPFINSQFCSNNDLNTSNITHDYFTYNNNSISLFKFKDSLQNNTILSNTIKTAFLLKENENINPNSLNLYSSLPIPEKPQNQEHSAILNNNSFLVNCNNKNINIENKDIIKNSFNIENINNNENNNKNNNIENNTENIKENNKLINDQYEDNTSILKYTPSTKIKLQFASEYQEEIFNYLLSLEYSKIIKYNYMTNQRDINEKMREILVDWLVDVHLKFKLLPETLFLTISFIDRYLEKVQVARAQLQLVGISSLLIASKYEEIYPPELKSYIYIADNAYEKEELLVMEENILSTLEYDLCYPSSLKYVEIISTKMNFLNENLSDHNTEKFNKMNYLLELMLLKTQFLKYTCLEQAIAAVYLIIDNDQDRKKLKQITSEIYEDKRDEIKEEINFEEKEKRINECILKLQEVAKYQTEEKTNLKAIYNKYKESKYSNASTKRFW